uniref:NADH-ubiquinone oxidoreductase chain 4 n=1 Tax=Scydmaeninae sp. 840139 TaxID=1213609 RepID=A0A0S2MS32_9COLE|nr:NADH deshydrogenase subunit 4 [Scydmaeninae sp. 840139]
MMKFLFMMIFMIPLSFFNNLFWFNQLIYMMMFLMFMLDFNYLIMFQQISFMFGCDMLSYTMILLSFWICSLMILASSKLYNTFNFEKFFMLMILFLMISLYCTFSTINMFLFYIFFEMSLIPTLFLIIGWGYQPERMQAGLYLLFYTLFGSLPLLIFIFLYYNTYNSINIFMLMKIDYKMYYFMMLFVFLIKMPMYFVHLWLPKAHVEASISGSMILAGVMLKLGGYGLMRFLPIFMKINMKLSWMIMLISLMGGAMISILCFRQIDMKCLIAYSSVAHMSLVLAGILTMNYWGMIGALIMMLAHGLCSSGLFCLVNITYERLMSRSLFINKGLINMMPSMSMWWFLLCSSSMAAPPSLNLLGEIMLINSLMSWSKLSVIFIIIMSFFSSVYSLYLYSYSQHGKLYSSMYSFSMGIYREYLLMFLHWIPLNLLILKSDLFMWI